MSTRNELRPQASRFLHYRACRDGGSLDVRLERGRIWLSEKQMADLLDKYTDTVGLHIHNVFREGELDESATAEESSVVQREAVHLAVPDHSSRFWLTVQSLCPETERARQWLTRNGESLPLSLEGIVAAASS